MEYKDNLKHLIQEIVDKKRGIIEVNVEFCSEKQPL